MPAKYRILLYPAKYKNGHQHPRLRLPASFLRPAPSRFFATTYADRRRCFRFRFYAAPVAPSANSLPFSASFAYTRRGKSNRVPSS